MTTASETPPRSNRPGDSNSQSGKKTPEASQAATQAAPLIKAPTALFLRPTLSPARDQTPIRPNETTQRELSKMTSTPNTTQVPPQLHFSPLETTPSRGEKSKNTPALRATITLDETIKEAIRRRDLSPERSLREATGLRMSSPKGKVHTFTLTPPKGVSLPYRVWNTFAGAPPERSAGAAATSAPSAPAWQSISAAMSRSIREAATPMVRRESKRLLEAREKKQNDTIIQAAAEQEAQAQAEDKDEDHSKGETNDDTLVVQEETGPTPRRSGRSRKPIQKYTPPQAQSKKKKKKKK